MVQHHNINKERRDRILDPPRLDPSSIKAGLFGRWKRGRREGGERKGRWRRRRSGTVRFCFGKKKKVERSLPESRWKASLMSANDFAKYPPTISTPKKHRHRTVTKISLRLFLVDSLVIITPLQTTGGGVSGRELSVLLVLLLSSSSSSFTSTAAGSAVGVVP